MVICNHINIVFSAFSVISVNITMSASVYDQRPNIICNSVITLLITLNVCFKVFRVFICMTKIIIKKPYVILCIYLKKVSCWILLQKLIFDVIIKMLGNIIVWLAIKHTILIVVQKLLC